MSKRLARLSLILLLLSLAGVGGTLVRPLLADPPESQLSSPAASVAVSQLFVTAGSDSTATPTPFQPIGPTLTPTLTPTATPTQAPTISAVGKVSLLLLGSDARPGQGYRTDVIMLVTIDNDNQSVSVISFPRDLYVYIPGWRQQRINTAFSVGGFSELAATFQYNFGIRPQYYFLTNFQSFVDVINDLDGISVPIAAPLTDKCDLHWGNKGYCTVEPGSRVMDGEDALWYVRSRHSTSDFDRTRRAQEVVFAMFSRMMKFNAITRLPELYAKYKGSVETNMGLEDIVPLLPVASQVVADSSRIHRYAVTPQMAYDFITEDGAMVLLPNIPAINAMINQALYGR